MTHHCSQMREFGVWTAACIVLAGISAVCQTARNGSQPGSVKTARPSGWVTYVDRAHGFCFSYPPIYTPTPKPWRKYTFNKKAMLSFRKAAQEGRMLCLQHKHDAHASILVFLEEKAFNLNSFMSRAPTGIEDPPERMQVGAETFYYYGPGGGGVNYADQYFFNLKGKTLYIIFDGPYQNDKTPSRETKDMEQLLLQTFRTF